MKKENNPKNIHELLESCFIDMELPESPKTLYDPVRYTLKLKGKYVRPKLVMLTCGMFGGNIIEALPAAISVEMLHNFTLIHDDIMDNANFRRGHPTIHKKWNLPVAILSGDVMFTKALEQLNYYGVNDTYSKNTFTRLTSRYLETIRLVCEGQALDMEFEKQPDIKLDDYLAMVHLKTAVLLGVSMELGSIISGQDQDIMDKCRLIGELTGLAFQIQDDIIDAVGYSEITGKKRGGDIIEGKTTILSVTARNKASETENQYLNSVMNSEKVNDQDVENVVSLYRKLNVISDAEYLVSSYYNQALDILNNFEESEYSNEIKSLLDQLMVRKS